ncbi:MAG: PGPGW domain-containing protein [Actinomycetota bacterium]
MRDGEREGLREAALHAEYETGARESTERAAKAHVAVRLARMTIGALVCLAGLVMLVAPGPGLVVVAIGLAILARDVAWADRLLGYVTARIPQDEQGGISRGAIVTMIVGGLAGVLLSVWWFGFR